MSFRALLENLQAGRSTKPPTRSRLYATELAVNPLTLSLVLSGKRRRCSYYQKHSRISRRTLDFSRVCARSFVWQLLLFVGDSCFADHCLKRAPSAREVVAKSYLHSKPTEFFFLLAFECAFYTSQILFLGRFLSAGFVTCCR